MQVSDKYLGYFSSFNGGFHELNLGTLATIDQPGVAL